MSSFGESKTLKLIEDPVTARSLVKYNTKQLSRWGARVLRLCSRIRCAQHLEHSCCSCYTQVVPVIRRLFLLYAGCSWYAQVVPDIRRLFLLYAGCSWYTQVVPDIRRLFLLYGGCSCYTQVVPFIFIILLRIYPAGKRQDSSNLDVVPPWAAGCQIGNKTTKKNSTILKDRSCFLLFILVHSHFFC